MSSRTVRILPPEAASLARGVPSCAPGTLFVLGSRGGIQVGPDSSLAVVFGRNEPDVHVCVGADDPGVSRHQGLIHRVGRHWSVSNTGQVPIRFPGSRLVLQGHDQVLPAAYTPLFIRTGARREHVLEVRVAGPTEPSPSAGHDVSTRHQEPWRLTEVEHLVLVSLAQRYLRADVRPQPLSWADVAADLHHGRVDQGWTGRKAETIVRRVRTRLSNGGVAGLTLEEVGEPVGNALNHNLIVELLLTTTLVAPDLALLTPPESSS